MRARYLVVGLVGALVGVLLSSAAIVLAGSLDPPSGPTDVASQMVTLEQIYDRLDTGAADAKMTSFTEPASEPGTGTMHRLEDIMAIAPAADDTNGAAPGDVLSGKTYWGLRADGAWGPHMGTAPPAPAPKTGQIDCWDSNGNSIDCDGTGQDGDLRKGVAWPDPRFTVNGDGTVTDNLTGLIWLQNADCFGKRLWADALSDANGLASGSCGLMDGSNPGDWRLPNIRELQSLIDYSQANPALPANPFTNVQLFYYWSSTTLSYSTATAWRVYMNNGFVDANVKNIHHLNLWPVRGGQ